MPKVKEVLEGAHPSGPDEGEWLFGGTGACIYWVLIPIAIIAVALVFATLTSSP